MLPTSAADGRAKRAPGGGGGCKEIGMLKARSPDEFKKLTVALLRQRVSVSIKANKHC